MKTSDRLAASATLDTAFHLQNPKGGGSSIRPERRISSVSFAYGVPHAMRRHNRKLVIFMACSHTCCAGHLGWIRAGVILHVVHILVDGGGVGVEVGSAS